MDLGELWRERRFRFLLNMISHLERTSQTREAMVQSEEFMAQVLGNGNDDSETRKGPRFSEFSPETEALYMVVDRLGDVCSGLVGLGGKKPRPNRPLPRPETAYDRVKRAQRHAEHEKLKARLSPTRSREGAASSQRPRSADQQAPATPSPTPADPARRPAAPPASG